MSKNRKRVRRSASRTQRKQLFERLEPRQLLAADLTFAAQTIERVSKDSEPPTLFYQAGDQEVGLSIRSDKIALAISPEQSDALPSNLVFERQLAGNLGVYTLETNGFDTGTIAPTASIGTNIVDSLATIQGIEFVTPVFYNANDDAELVATNEVIVALDPAQSPDEYFASQDVFADFRALRGSSNQFVATLATGTGIATVEVSNKLIKDEGVEWATPNFYFNIEKFYTPNDPRFTNQWHLENTGQGGGLVGADSNLTEAWDVNAGGSAEIVIGIVDDAVDMHEDLLLFTNPGEIAGNGIDDDGNGWIDDIHGWNFVSDNNVSTPTFADDVHGTAVAGVAAAQGDNGLGVTGASYKSPVIAARIFEGPNTATEANIAEALRYMAGFTADGTGTWRSADVVNNSWGGGGVSAAINSALADGTTIGRQGKGTPYFFATGNGFASSPSQPAAQAVNIPGVFAIGATNNFGERSNYSNYGTGLDFVTPSNDTRAGYLAIDTTDRESTAGYNTSLDGNYTGNGATGFGGTSSATPLASGIAALTLAELEATGREFTPTVLREYLRANTNLIGGATYDPTTGWNAEFGYGRLDAGSALANIGKPEISVLSSTEDLSSGTSDVDLGSAVVGLTPAQTTIRVRNQGTEPLNLTNLTVSSGPFSLASGLGSNVLGVGEWTTFVVEFLPTVAGSATGSATLTSSDNDEASFIVNLTGLGLVASVSGVAFEDHNADGTQSENEQATEGSIAYLDLNNNSQRDITLETYDTTVPVNILDNTEVFSPLVVTGASEPVSSITVEVDITHTWVDDLDLVLIAPDGTEVLLASAVGGNGDNFTDTVFDDSASQSIVDGNAPFTGSFRPQQALAGLLNVDPNGTWQLSVQDFATGDEGQILGWSLSLASSEPSLSTEVDGSYAFFNLPNGDYVLRNEPPAGWAQSTAASYEFTINGSNDAFGDRNFGVGKNDRFYGLVFEDADGDGTQDSGEQTLTNWTVYRDDNANGTYESPTTTTLTNSNSLAINDNTVVTSNLVASGISGVVLDVDVKLNITHTFAADLELFLTAPDGTRVELFTDVGGGGNNFIDTILDDDAATSIVQGDAPFTGSFRPEGQLADFNGQMPNGTWQLEVGDDAGGDVGTLNSWELIVTTGEVNQQTNPFGEAVFDLPTGDHTLGLVLEPDWEFTFPNDGFILASASGAPIYSQAFGVREAVQSEVTTRGIYYNNASGSQLGSGGDAAAALDPTKQPLLPGETSTFANYSNYQKGLNGFLFDITGLSAGATEQEVLDSLQFAVWNGIDSAGFVDLPAAAVPSVELVTIGDDMRVKVSFPDGTLMNTWLRTTVVSNSTTNLPIDDIFYFGHVLGDVGQGNTSTRIRVNAIDTVFVRSNQSLAANSADASNPYDINRDGRVNALDTVLVRANQQLAGIVAPLNAPDRSKANSSDGKDSFLKSDFAAPSSELVDSTASGTQAPIIESLNQMAGSRALGQSRPSLSSVSEPPADLQRASDARLTNGEESLQAPLVGSSNGRSGAARETGPATSDSRDQVFDLIGSGAIDIRIGRWFYSIDPTKQTTAGSS